ncbi:gephyrin-like molybdotransferase Glp [Methylobacterium sp. J-070]|uniref:molybdopterin molybdotransferase MoeA n=1 Tax=Methylobacterium sp. J-070 TaxID=2836650 RepID=UPI001FBAD3F8|nr:gephyrin-like molybdotransferase Glp [Methylobacterium sp. J-070]MCJ2050649.1 molybdopterin molybdotransferase MoeA [Methylobacterium sp. J-070]
MEATKPSEGGVAELVEVGTALDRMAALLHRVGAASVVLDDALGRVAAIDIVARLDAPPFPVAAMDGYALRWNDAGVPLPCTGAIKAGDTVGTLLSPGTCHRIFTGAPIPPGADTVVIQELTEQVDGRIVLRPGAEPCRHIRAAGSNFERGQPIVRAGRRLGARDIGLLASSGHLHARVYSRPRIAVLSMGDELSESLTPGSGPQIIDANRPTLKALVRAWGGIPIDLGIVRDDPDALARILSTVDADLLVTSGGASVGDFDFLSRTLAGLGFEAAFHKVRMRPGKATLFGTVRSLPILGVPGNACAAMIAALVFLKPAIALLGGAGRQDAVRERAVLGAPIAAVGPRTTFLRGRIDREANSCLTFKALPSQDNAMLSSLAAADAVAVRPASAPAARTGDSVEIVRFDTVAGF